jgi:hypothetical protein
VSLTLTYAWWHVPATLSAVAAGYLCLPTDDTSFDSMIKTGVALFIVAVAWAIAGAIK